MMSSPPALLPLTIPLSWAYRAAVAIRNRRFDRRLGVQRLDRPVISVGNITVGGTGKTPMVMWIAKQLIDAGRQPVIAMRGYGAAAPSESDERMEYRELLPDTPVVADPDRVRALREFFRHGGSDEFNAVILDDGFQHRRLHRDLDLVLVDSTARTMKARLLPAGLLREPAANLRRASSVIVTRADSVDPTLSRQIEQAHGRPPIAWCRSAWESLDVHENGLLRAESVSWLQGRRVATMFGVGNPRAVEAQVGNAGATILDRIAARDHQEYSASFLAAARLRCRHEVDALVITGKDWVKLRGTAAAGDWPVSIVIPRLRIDFVAGESALRARLLEVVGAADALAAG